VHLSDNDELHPIYAWTEEAEESNDKARDQAYKDTAQVFRVFSSPEGKELLKKWTGTLIEPLEL